jgi:hypothetical protein
VKILELLHPFKHGYAKARIRRVTHDDVVEDTVNYADLSPVGTARPELMLERKIDLHTGNMLFFEAQDGKIQAGLLLSKVNSTLTVHMLRQAQKRDRRFVPLYRLKSGAIEPKEKPPRTAEMVVEVVEQNMVLASTTLEKYLIPDSSLPNLQSRGIIVNPLVQEADQQVPYSEGPLVFPITRMTKREQQLYMSALRTLCKALNISPFGRMEDILARVHSAADNAGLQIFVAQEYWFPSLQQLNELIEQVADDDALYQHNHLQLQHSAWLLSQPPAYATDEALPDMLTQVTAVEPMQLPSITNYTPVEATVEATVAPTRCEVAPAPISMTTVVLMTMVAYATWEIMNVIHNYKLEIFT